MSVDYEHGLTENVEREDEHYWYLSNEVDEIEYEDLEAAGEWYDANIGE